MSYPASAKVTRPRSAQILPRTRLYTQLDQARAYPVIWVTGPPGAGKTTLISSYLDIRQFKSTWYQIDAGDNDPATFFHYMDIAAHQASPRSRKSLPAFTHEHHSNICLFARRYFEALYARITPPALLILDNYQEIPSSSPFHEMIAVAISMMPAEVNLMILSRAEPPPAFVGLRAHDAVSILSSTELKLTLHESRAIAQLRNEDAFDISVADQLHQRADSWITGLMLLLEQPDYDMQTAYPKPQHAGYQVLFDYFATKIFNSLDNVTQEILCKAALLPKAAVNWVQTLSGRPEAETVLAELYRRNYFVIKHEPDKTYQFHPLFQEFLLHRAQVDFTPAELTALRTRAGTLLEVAGNIEAAAELWCAASEWRLMEAHILKHAPQLAAQVRFQLLEKWLSALPDSALAHTPWLRYWFGVCRMQTDLTEAQVHFELAYAGFTLTDEAMGLYASWSRIVGCIFMRRQNFTALTPWLGVLEHLRERHPQWPSAAIELHVVTAAVMGYSGNLPDHPKMRSWLAHGLHLIDKFGYTTPCIQLANHAVLALYWLGESRQATLLVKSLEHTVKNLKNAPLTEICWYAISMIHSWQRLEPQTTLQILDEAMACINTSGVHVMDGILHTHAVYAALAINDLTAAESLLQNVSTFFHPDSTLDLAHYWFLRGLIAIHSGSITKAIDYGNKAVSLAQAATMPFGIACGHHGLAVAWHEAGERNMAQKHLQSMRAIGKSMGSRQIAYWCSAMDAYFAFAEEDTASAKHHLAITLALSREMDGSPMYWWPSKTVAQLYAKALEYNIETDHVRELIRRLGLVPADCATTPDTWPFPVKIYSLGRFSVQIHGKPLIFTGKAQKKPLELLKGLIAFGGREVREDKLAHALWPAAEDALQALATTLHRLRKLIGENIVERSEGCLTLNPRYCWVDVWTIERQMAQLEQACQARHLIEIIPRIERIFARYGSGFLVAETDSRWAITARDRLRSKLLRHIEIAADVLTKTHQHDAAIGCYRKALELDPLTECLYYGLMQCYAASGRSAEALSTYQRCTTILDYQFGVIPSPRTEALARQLQQN